MRNLRNLLSRWTTTVWEPVSRAAEPWLTWAVELCFDAKGAACTGATPSPHAMAAVAVCVGSAFVRAAVPCAGPCVDLAAGLAIATVARRAVEQVASRHGVSSVTCMDECVRATRSRTLAHAMLASDGLAIAVGRTGSGWLRQRSLASWLPVLGGGLEGLSWLRDAARTVELIHGLERRAESLCTAPSATVLALRRTPPRPRLAHAA